MKDKSCDLERRKNNFSSKNREIWSFHVLASQIPIQSQPQALIAIPALNLKHHKITFKYSPWMHLCVIGACCESL